MARTNLAGVASRPAAARRDGSMLVVAATIMLPPCVRRASESAHSSCLASRSDVGVERGEPVGGDQRLGLAQRQASRRAHEPVQLVLQAILFVEPRAWISSLRPQVADAVTAAEFERDQMIDLVLA